MIVNMFPINVFIVYHSTVVTYQILSSFNKYLYSMYVVVCYSYMVEGYYQLCIHLLNNNLKSFWSEIKKNMRIQFSIHNQPLFRIFNVYVLLDGKNESVWWEIIGIQWNSSILDILEPPKCSRYVLGCPKIQAVSSILGVWNREVSLHTGESLVHQLSNIFGELMYCEFVVPKLFFFEYW